MPAERKIRIIPATVNMATRMPIVSQRKRRVAAYARVSTDKDEQFTSFEAQIDYYQKMILQNPAWEYVGMYSDEGITGTSTRHRDGFNEMIENALNGEIDLIVTKSVSRFARNTVDSLVTVRKLKEKGVEVFFEKENIYTLDSKGELLITIMSSLAQEESRSISENVTWGHRKRFSDGKFSMAYSTFLGYDRGANKDAPPAVNPKQAVLVKRIYREFMSGKTTCTIAKDLTQEGVPTPGGKQNWAASTIESILTNEKYMGAARLQKSFTTDFLTKKLKKNEGEVPQYWIENSHEAIIPPDEWQAVQNELVRRKSFGRHYSGGSILSSRIVCGDCGGLFGPKTWNSTDQYRKVIWRCVNKYKGTKCKTPHVVESDIKDGFIIAFNQMMGMKEEIIANFEYIRTTLTDCTDIDVEAKRLSDEAEVIAGLTRKLINDNATRAIKQEDFAKRYAEYDKKHQEITQKLDALDQERALRMHRVNVLDSFMNTILRSTGGLTQFDDRLWQTTIENVTIGIDGKKIYRFFNGTEIEV